MSKFFYRYSFTEKVNLNFFLCALCVSATSALEHRGHRDAEDTEKTKDNLVL